jgi:hypothetical protein
MHHTLHHVKGTLMQETPQQYIERILGHLKGAAPATVLSATPGKLKKLLRGVPRRKLTKRPEPGRWSAAEILAHLADTELVSGFRMRLILGKSGTPIQAFDQDAWSGSLQYAKQDPVLSMEAFRVQRERNIRMLRLIPSGMWENFGMHEERGKETITRITEMMAGHDINHLKQIEQMLRPKAKQKVSKPR